MKRCVYLVYVISFVSFLTNSATCSPFDDDNDDDISTNFITLEALHYLTVDDYEIIQIGHNRKAANGDENLKIRRFGRSTTFSANSSESTLIRERTPIFLAREGKVELADESIIREAVKFYENTSVVTLFKFELDKHYNPYFIGSIDDRSVGPLSKRAVRSLMSEKPHLFKDTLPPGSIDGDSVLSSYHVLYTPKIEERSVKYFINNSAKHETAYSRHRRSSGTVYPEILLIVDYNERYTSPREFRFLQVLTYVIRFWNSVDLRFRTLTDPKVRLRITGIVISMEPQAIRLIGKSMNRQSGALDAAKVIRRAFNWVRSQPSIAQSANYDIIMTMTSLDLCDYDARWKRCFKGRILGLANVRGDCSHKHVMTGVFHDNRNFKDVGIAAHELGHILGASHDSPNSVKSCLDTNGYIMSWTSGYEDRPFEWSRCSQNDFRVHLKSSAASCYQNENPVDDIGPPVKELLPGPKVTTEKQCDKLGYGKVCDNDNCKNLRCRHTFWFCVNTGAPALDGTPCSNGGTCRNGVCEK